MTEERKKELARSFFETSTEDVDGDVWELINIVAAEARKEGIEKFCNSLPWEQRHGTYGRVALINEAEIKRLKEKGK